MAAKRTTAETSSSPTPAGPETPEEAPKNAYGPRIPGSVAGNLTRDPELRFTASGIPTASLSVAFNARTKNGDGEWVEAKPHYYNVTVWRDQATRVTECFKLGTRVTATGYFQDRTFTTKDGDQKTVTEFTAEDIGPSLRFRAAKVL